MDFSWTWKEKRKNASDVLMRAKEKFCLVGWKKRRRLEGSDASAVAAKQATANVWTS
jgi:hypothetical protein